MWEQNIAREMNRAGAHLGCASWGVKFEQLARRPLRVPYGCGTKVVFMSSVCWKIQIRYD
jgi:hypothetical protein